MQQNVGTLANMAITETAAKVGLCCCTFAFTFVGLALMILGAFLATTLHQYSEFLPTNISVTVPGTLLVMVGIVVIIVAICCFCGTSRESPFVICMFGMLLLLILVLEMAGGILAYKYRGNLKSELGISMFEFERIAATPGGDQASAMKAWDYIQPSLLCCGTETYEDWSFIFGVPVPKSCNCDLNTVPAPRCTTTPQGSTVFSQGCRQMLHLGSGICGSGTRV
ncbi:hypothetical protein B566_EDAN002424 [Ephemera danica]|nr:hypothetical protein B566_EDAN002424 [Ephemera danica]